MAKRRRVPKRGWGVIPIFPKKIGPLKGYKKWRSLILQRAVSNANYLQTQRSKGNKWNYGVSF